ncbi:hypothetical protein GF326_05720 [Candidatus Bathyarchaeota archaeon]|nr:hypothetical protein [Candidatus Bathyarchaeota archaeon]
MDQNSTGVCSFAWRCLKYKPHAAACNREGGGSFCGLWRKYNGQRTKKKDTEQ